MCRYFGLFVHIVSIFSIIQLANSITQPIEAIAPSGMQLRKKYAPMTPQTILVILLLVILHDVNNGQNIFGFELFVASSGGISEGLAEEGGPEDAWGGGFMLMTVASFTELECFFLPFFQ